MYLIPALLSNDVAELRSVLIKLLPHFTHFQVDIQDGIFVPSHTLSISEYMDTIRECAGDQSVTIDFHLMLTEYADALTQIEHIQSAPSLPPGVAYGRSLVRTTYVHTNIGTDLLSPSTALTFNPEDRVEEWGGFLKESKYAQVMTIHPGPQGQTFMPQTLTKIGQIKSINSDCIVCIDGGVNEESIGFISSQQALCVPDECAVGSYFSRATVSEMSERIQKLTS
ncbi:MAG: hypothetical protein WCJ70_05055 [bacterium]